MRSECCNETISRPVPGIGKWTCDNCHGPTKAKHAPLAVRPGETGASLIVVAVTGMLPGTSGTFHAPDANLGSRWETRALTVARDSETEWSTYHGVSMSADDRSWSDTVAMACYIQATVL